MNCIIIKHNIWYQKAIQTTISRTQLNKDTKTRTKYKNQYIRYWILHITDKRRISRTAETSDNGNDNDENQNKQKYNPNAHPLPATFLILFSTVKILCTIFNIMRSMKNMMFNIIHFFTLCFNHNSHIQKYLMKFQQTLLNLFCCIMSVLNLNHSFQNLSSSMFLYCLP